MRHVVFLRGVNVGGRKAFRPSAVAERLSRLDVTSIGAAGTFVVRAEASAAAVRDGADWQVSLIAIRGRLAMSLHRRMGRTLVYPNEVIEKRLGVAATTRNWSTIVAICRQLSRDAARDSDRRTMKKRRRESG